MVGDGEGVCGYMFEELMWIVFVVVDLNFVIVLFYFLFLFLVCVVFDLWCYDMNYSLVDKIGVLIVSKLFYF